jgi:hypothetical protein
MDDRRRIVIYLGEADAKWIELQAAGNVSSWCRDRILEGRDHQSEELPRDNAIRSPVGRQSVAGPVVAV